MIATAPHIAAAAWGYYSAFREQGFSGRESVYLVAVQFKDSPGTP